MGAGCRETRRSMSGYLPKGAARASSASSMLADMSGKTDGADAAIRIIADDKAVPPFFVISDAKDSIRLRVEVVAFRDVAACHRAAAALSKLVSPLVEMLPSGTDASAAVLMSLLTPLDGPTSSLDRGSSAYARQSLSCRNIQHLNHSSSASNLPTHAEEDEEPSLTSRLRSMPAPDFHEPIRVGGPGPRRKPLLPLVLAVLESDVEAVKLCVQAKASLESLSPDGESLVNVAARKGNRDMMRVLLEAGAPASASMDGTTPLHAAAESGVGECVALALQWGSHVEAVDQGGHTPLLLACMAGAVGCVRRLLDVGADANATTADGLSPLHVCARDDRENLIAPLVGAGADLERLCLHDEERQSPLILAVRNGAIGAIRGLLAAGADPRAPLTKADGTIVTPSQLARDEDEEAKESACFC